MADILFNKSGIPLIAYGKSYQATTTGTPAEKPKNTSLGTTSTVLPKMVWDTRISSPWFLN